MALLAGSRYTMNCSTDNYEISICWHYRSTTVEIKFLYNGVKFNLADARRYSIDKNDQGRVNLVVNSASQNHAGTYTCVEAGSTNSSSAELVVLGKFLNFVWPLTVLPTFSISIISNCSYHGIHGAYEVYMDSCANWL